MCYGACDCVKTPRPCSTQIIALYINGHCTDDRKSLPERLNHHLVHPPRPHFTSYIENPQNPIIGAYPVFHALFNAFEVCIVGIKLTKKKCNSEISSTPCAEFSNTGPIKAHKSKAYQMKSTKVTSPVLARVL